MALVERCEGGCLPNAGGAMAGKVVARKAGAKKPSMKRGIVATARNIGDEIIAGLREAVAFERGEETGAAFKAAPISARNVTIAPAPEYDGKGIAIIRKRLGVSQAVFAAALNVNAETVKGWEQSKFPPNGAAKRLLQIVEKYPAIVAELMPRRVAEPTVKSTAGRSGAARTTKKPVR